MHVNNVALWKGGRGKTCPWGKLRKAVHYDFYINFVDISTGRDGTRLGIAFKRVLRALGDV